MNLSRFVLGLSSTLLGSVLDGGCGQTCCLAGLVRLLVSCQEAARRALRATNKQRSAAACCMLHACSTGCTAASGEQVKGQARLGSWQWPLHTGLMHDIHERARVTCQTALLLRHLYSQTPAEATAQRCALHGAAAASFRSHPLSVHQHTGVAHRVLQLLSAGCRCSPGPCTESAASPHFFLPAAAAQSQRSATRWCAGEPPRRRPAHLHPPS